MKALDFFATCTLCVGYTPAAGTATGPASAATPDVASYNDVQHAPGCAGVTAQGMSRCNVCQATHIASLATSGRLTTTKRKRSAPSKATAGGTRRRDPTSPSSRHRFDLLSPTQLKTKLRKLRKQSKLDRQTIKRLQRQLDAGTALEVDLPGEALRLVGTCSSCRSVQSRELTPFRTIVMGLGKHSDL